MYGDRRRRQRSRRRAVGVALLLLALLSGGGAGWWAYSLPGSIELTATPADATIVMDNTVRAVGSLAAEDVEIGVHLVVVTRVGYEPLETSIDVKRWRTTRATYTLTPLPQKVTVTTSPAGAAITLTDSAGAVHTGTSPLSAMIPSGEVRVEIALAGYDTFERTLAVDRPADLTYYLDPEGQVLHALGTIDTKGAPKGVSITPDGREAWTSILNGPPSIEIFDVATGRKLGGVDIGEHGAVEVIFNEEGTLAYTSQMETAKCFEIDVATRKVLREFDTESSWTKWVELSPDESMLYASNWSGDDVSVIELETGELIKRVRVSNTPRGMHASDDGRYLYVGGFDSGDLERIDLQTYKVKTLFTGGGALRHIVADESRGVLYISDMAKDLVWAHDVKTGKTSKFADTDEKPNTIDLTPDGKMLFVSCRGENNATSYYLPGPEWGSILVFDTASGKPLDALIAGNQPTALDVSTDGTVLMFSDFLDDRLRTYQIPPYDEFAAGNGGRYQATRSEITK